MRLVARSVVVGALAVAGACSDSETSTAVTEQPTTTHLTAPSPNVGAGDETETTLAVATDGPTTTVVLDTEASITTFPVVEVAESGIPGIDSEDAFCAAWSRFGGSWQVIQVAANFAPDPSIVPAMEVVASPVIGDAYDAMFEAWPEELVTERSTVADGFFGPLDRRALAAETALVVAGATPDDIAAIGDAWVAALATRDLENPVLTPELTDDQWALVDAAAATFADQLVEFRDDPSMRITVETPRTDAYLATACPDQGALTGTEVDAG
jgi:hypothetical protein